MEDRKITFRLKTPKEGGPTSATVGIQFPNEAKKKKAEFIQKKRYVLSESLFRQVQGLGYFLIVSGDTAIDPVTKQAIQMKKKVHVGPHGDIDSAIVARLAELSDSQKTAILNILSVQARPIVKPKSSETDKLIEKDVPDDPFINDEESPLVDEEDLIKPFSGEEEKAPIEVATKEVKKNKVNKKGTDDPYEDLDDDDEEKV